MLPAFAIVLRDLGIPLRHGIFHAFAGHPSASSNLLRNLLAKRKRNRNRIARCERLRKFHAHHRSRNFECCRRTIGSNMFNPIFSAFGFGKFMDAVVYGRGMDGQRTLIHHAAGLEGVRIEMEPYFTQRIRGMIRINHRKSSIQRVDRIDQCYANIVANVLLPISEDRNAFDARRKAKTARRASNFCGHISGGKIRTLAPLE